jgi:WD40 repeat protein
MPFCDAPVTVRMWDIRHGKLKQELKGHSNGVRCVAYSNPHKLILSAGFDHTALVWNPFMEKCEICGVISVLP